MLVAGLLSGSLGLMLSFLFFFKNLLLIYVHGILTACMSVCHMHAVRMEVRRGC